MRASSTASTWCSRCCTRAVPRPRPAACPPAHGRCPGRCGRTNARPRDRQAVRRPVNEPGSVRPKTIRSSVVKRETGAGQQPLDQGNQRGGRLAWRGAQNARHRLLGTANGKAYRCWCLARGDSIVCSGSGGRALNGKGQPGHRPPQAISTGASIVGRTRWANEFLRCPETSCRSVLACAPLTGWAFPFRPKRLAVASRDASNSPAARRRAALCRRKPRPPLPRESSVHGGRTGFGAATGHAPAGHRADEPSNPASVMKLVTTHAALETAARPSSGARRCLWRASRRTAACAAMSISVGNGDP